MYGKLDNDANKNLPDMTRGEKWALIPLVILIFVLGIYPTPTTLNKVSPAVATVMKQSQPTYFDPFAAPDSHTAAAAAPRLAAAPVQPKGSHF